MPRVEPRHAKDCSLRPTIRFRSSCCSTQNCAATGRRCARKNSASGRPIAGRRRPLPFGPSPAVFAALGMRRGDKIAIIGDNRPQFYWSMLAAQSLGACAGAGLSGRSRRRDAVRARSRGDTLRCGREPGAGGQADRHQGSTAASRTHHLQGSARSAPLSGTTTCFRSMTCRSRAARSMPRIPAFLPGRGRQG